MINFLQNAPIQSIGRNGKDARRGWLYHTFGHGAGSAPKGAIVTALALDERAEHKNQPFCLLVCECGLSQDKKRGGETMSMLMSMEVEGNDELERLYRAYLDAKKELGAYLWREKLTVSAVQTEAGNSN